MSKIIHSFWSRPLRAAGGPTLYAGSWKSPRSHLHSWVLSAMRAKESHGNITLVTDTEGARLLVDRLGLPYDDVKVTLDAADAEAPPELWAYGKLLAYEQQDEPFLHIDADVYLWKRLPDDLLNGRVVVQSTEGDSEFTFMDGVYLRPRARLNGLSVAKPDSWNKVDITKAYNCGIFGGTDMEAIRGYVAEAKKFVRDCAAFGWRNLKIPTQSMNVIFEQLTLYTYMAAHDVPVSQLYDPEQHPDAEVRAMGLGYTHMMGHKSGVVDPNVLDRLAARVRNEYPEQHERIERLFAPPVKLSSPVRKCGACARRAAARKRS